MWERWGSLALWGLGGSLFRGTNETKDLRLSLKGIRVRLSPGPCPRGQLVAELGLSLRGGTGPLEIQVLSSIPMPLGAQ